MFGATEEQSGSIQLFKTKKTLSAFQALLQGVACQEQDGQSGMGFCVRRVPLGDANTHDGAYGRCARNATSRLSTQNPAISATIHVLSPVAVPRLRPCYPPAPNSLGRRRKKIISFTSDVYRGVTPTILSTSTFFFFFRQRRGGLEHGEHPALPLEVADEARERQEPLGCHMGGRREGFREVVGKGRDGGDFHWGTWGRRKQRIGGYSIVASTRATSPPPRSMEAGAKKTTTGHAW